MFPLDPASGPGEGTRGQAVAHGGTFVRPGAIAWAEAPGAPGRGPSSTGRQLPVAVAASRAWLSVPGAGEGLVFSVTLEDPAYAIAHAAVVGAIR